MPRAFIVGNGPSLGLTPLDKMIDEVCFATNRIHLIYDKTEWRPNYYVRAESSTDIKAEHWVEDVLVHLRNPEIETWLNYWFYKKLALLGYEEKWEGVEIINGCAHYEDDYDSSRAPVLWHPPKLCTFGSSLHVAIQIAINKGYGPLYLVGCDLGFDEKQIESHFDPDYAKGYEAYKMSGRIANMNCIAGHIQAKKSSPVDIYNATIGGQLHAYERRDLDAILGNR